jgi:hypothetical protein
MTERTANAPRPAARLIGAVYLAYFVTAVLAASFLKGIVVPGDAAATAGHLASHAALFRLGLSTNLVATACYIAVTALFYELFRPVDRTLSILAAFFSLVGCAVQAVGYLFDLVPALVFGNPAYSSAFTPDQMNALTLMSLAPSVQAPNVYLVFFGFYCLLLGVLVVRCSFLPRALGVLLVIAGAGWLSFLWPPLAGRLSAYVLPFGFLAEAALMLWLLVVGVNSAAWRKKVMDAT